MFLPSFACLLVCSHVQVVFSSSFILHASSVAYSVAIEMSIFFFSFPDVFCFLLFYFVVSNPNPPQPLFAPALAPRTVDRRRREDSP